MNKTLYLIVSIGKHFFATRVDNVEDVIRQGKITKVRLANENIEGLLNLRGHIVTQISVAKTLGIERSNPEKGFAIVIMLKGEFYSLTFDKIGDVIEIADNDIAPIPETVKKSWHQLSKGVYRLHDKLLVLLDLEAFIQYIGQQINPKIMKNQDVVSANAPQH